MLSLILCAFLKMPTRRYVPAASTQCQYDKRTMGPTFYIDDSAFTKIVVNTGAVVDNSM